MEIAILNLSRVSQTGGDWGGALAPLFSRDFYMYTFLYDLFMFEATIFLDNVQYRITNRKNVNHCKNLLLGYK